MKTCLQGLTLVHSSAQLKRLLCDKGVQLGVVPGVFMGGQGVSEVFRVRFCVRNGSS